MAPTSVFYMALWLCQWDRCVRFVCILLISWFNGSRSSDIAVKQKTKGQEKMGTQENCLQMLDFPKQYIKELQTVPSQWSICSSHISYSCCFTWEPKYVLLYLMWPPQSAGNINCRYLFSMTRSFQNYSTQFPRLCTDMHVCSLRTFYT